MIKAHIGDHAMFYVDPGFWFDGIVLEYDEGAYIVKDEFGNTLRFKAEDLRVINGVEV